jgi:hypothetical protein
MKLRPFAFVLTGLLPLCGATAQDGFDKEAVALIYHRVSGDPLDFPRVAEQSDAVRGASGFDRPDVLKAEIARLQTQAASIDPSREFVVSVNDSISQYDHDRSEFSIQLFAPGYFVPVDAFRQQYQIVFVNAESARAIPMPKEEARAFDGELTRMGRSVLNEVHFRVIGKGDPSGAVTGARVVRAEILSARLLDREGHVVFTPKVAPAPAASAGSQSAFDASKADIAGFRVGVPAKELEAMLARLLGAVRRSPSGKGAERYAGALHVNEMGCFSIPGRKSPVPGTVCATAHFDKDDVVRSIRIERVFPWLDSEVLRKTLVQKYGSVAFAQGGASGLALGWGPAVDQTADRSAPRHALFAQYISDEDFMSRSLNRLPNIRVVLHLVDAQWMSGSH